MSNPTLEERLKKLSDELDEQVDGQPYSLPSTFLPFLRQAANLGEERMREEAAKVCDAEEVTMRRSAEQADDSARLYYREGGEYAAARLADAIRAIKLSREGDNV